VSQTQSLSPRLREIIQATTWLHFTVFSVARKHAKQRQSQRQKNINIKQSAQFLHKFALLSNLVSNDSQVHSIINCYIFQLMSNSTSMLSSAVFSSLQCGPSNSSPAFSSLYWQHPPRRT